MSDTKTIARDIARAIKEEPKGKTSPFDTTATVNRIEGGTAWVQIPGGVDETPVQLTLNAKEGDAVQVRVAGGKAWITGNGTNPPTDDTRANQANETAIYAQTIAENAEGSARRASLAADVAEAKAQAASDAAQAASDAAEEAWDKADDAETAAGQAQTSAQTANSAANGALTSLSTVQDVIGMLNWAADNADYSLTQDTDIVPGKTYWTRSGAGTEADPYVYTPVTNPVKTDLNIYYEISGVDEAMGDFINAHLALTEEGLWILPDGMDAQSYRVLIATGGQGHTYEDAGTYIIDSAGKTVAKLGEVITLGVDDGTQSVLMLDYHSMQMFDSYNVRSQTGRPFFHVSDIIDKEGYITDAYTADGSTMTFKLSATTYSSYEVTVDDVVVSSGITKNYTNFVFSTAPSSGKIIKAKYKPYTVIETFPAFTFGGRKKNNPVGLYSFAEGQSVIASGAYSHAEGGMTSIAAGECSHSENNGKAYGDNSHAENSARANGERSHAENKGVANGTDSHAEGGGMANGEFSHAEGGGNAYGEFSHAQNRGTSAQKKAQTVLGTFNVLETGNTTTHPSGDIDYGKYGIIFGNGSNGSPSDALKVEWSGNVWIAGTVTENNGTRDIDLNISEATIQKYVDLGMSLT